ncbi:MAG: PKD domain-containing protein [Candidatus Thermoplasmatota archaeon]|nr:PKD domain-containing protein [Candidatus Thermoplasmatota archaeon]
MSRSIGKREIVIVAVFVLVVGSIGAYFMFFRGPRDDPGEDINGEKDHRPDADAGYDQTITSGEPAILNASGSRDKDNDILYFKWDVDAGIDEDNDGIKDNDWEISGMIVEWTYPEVTKPISFIATVNVSDGGSWSTATTVVNVLVNESTVIPEVMLSCTYQQQIPYFNSHFIVTVDDVTSIESIFNYSYTLENVDGDMISNGTIVSLIPSGPNATEIAFIDTPEIGSLDSMDAISFKEGTEIIEGCYLMLYYKRGIDPVGEIELSK